MTILLQPADQSFLTEEFNCVVVPEGGLVCVVFEQFPLVAGLVPAASDLLVRLPAGFPDAHPDMFWFADDVVRADGQPIPAINVVETYLDRTWHRWSRHVGEQWRPGVDDLRSYVGYIHKCLLKAAA